MECPGPSPRRLSPTSLSPLLSPPDHRPRTARCSAVPSPGLAHRCSLSSYGRRCWERGQSEPASELMAVFAGTRGSAPPASCLPAPAAASQAGACAGSSGDPLPGSAGWRCGLARAGPGGHPGSSVSSRACLPSRGPAQLSLGFGSFQSLTMRGRGKRHIFTITSPACLLEIQGPWPGPGPGSPGRAGSGARSSATPRGPRRAWLRFSGT